MTKSYALKKLIQLYKSNGYSRSPNKKREKKESWAEYKKGHEIRIVLYDRESLRNVRKLIKATGINLSKSYKNVNRFIQPIYGYDNYLKFEKH